MNGGTQILLAEDDTSMRRLMARALRRDNHRVVELESGPSLEAESLRLHGLGATPSLIVSDIRLPGMSGLEVLRRVRALGWSIPVVLVTAFGDEETLNAAARLGATLVFSKPFELDDLRIAARIFAR
jgi:CheY-like chemotaxis protein